MRWDKTWLPLPNINPLREKQSGISTWIDRHINKTESNIKK